MTLDFKNTGRATVVYHVRSGNTKTGPWSYTVAPGTEVSDIWNLSTNPGGEYDLSVYGPNGFLRSFSGKTAGQSISNVHVTSRYEDRSGITLAIVNRGSSDAPLSILDVYTGNKTTHNLKPGDEFLKTWSLERFHNWYDLVVKVSSDSSFQRRVAGHARSEPSTPVLG